MFANCSISHNSAQWSLLTPDVIATLYNMMPNGGALAAAAANDAGGDGAGEVAVQQMAIQYDSFLQPNADGVYNRLQNADTADARNVTDVYAAGIDGVIRRGALGSLPALRSINNPIKLQGVRQGIARAIRGVDDARYANGPGHETLHLRDIYGRVIACLEETCAPQDLANAKRAYEDVLVTHVIHSIVRIHAANMDSDED